MSEGFEQRFKPNVPKRKTEEQIRNEQLTSRVGLELVNIMMDLSLGNIKDEEQFEQLQGTVKCKLTPLVESGLIKDKKNIDFVVANNSDYMLDEYYLALKSIVDEFRRHG